MYEVIQGARKKREYILLVLVQCRIITSKIKLDKATDYLQSGSQNAE